MLSKLIQGIIGKLSLGILLQKLIKNFYSPFNVSSLSFPIQHYSESEKSLLSNIGVSGGIINRAKKLCHFNPRGSLFIVPHNVCQIQVSLSLNLQIAALFGFTKQVSSLFISFQAVKPFA